MTSFEDSAFAVRAIADLQARSITARPRDPTVIYLNPTEAVYFGLEEGDKVSVDGYEVAVQIVRPIPEATMPGEIIERARKNRRRKQ